MKKQSRVFVSLLGLLGALLAFPTASAQAQNAVITGKVLSDVGAVIEDANVVIIELAVSVRTNALGMYAITVPAARVQGQAVALRVRAIGYTQGVIGIRVTPGPRQYNFELKKDINRLSEVVVTGSIEGTERSKVPFNVGRVSAQDLVVPAADPIRALGGKVGGLRIAQSSGQPGAETQILMRGPTSINATGRSQSPLIIVDGAIQRVGSLDEIGGLDIESVEVVKGAAGASLYGATAANGVIIVKTKRGSNVDAVRWTFRSEMGITDVSSLNYGMPLNHNLQLDETGKRFCVSGASNVAPCSRTLDWMTEIMRVNNVAADTVRTAQNVQFNAVSASGGELLNDFQASIWPNHYYNSFAQISTSNPISINSIEAEGRAGSVRYFVSGAATNDHGAIKQLNGQQQKRVRMNLDYAPRSDMTMAVSMMVDKAITDRRSGGSSNGTLFGQLMRGAPAGTDYLARDTLGRLLVLGGGAPLKGSGNGAGTLLYDTENLGNVNTSNRILGTLNTTYTPTDWATFEGTFAYDNRSLINNNWVKKGYRTFTVSSANNSGNQGMSNLWEEAMNAQVSATVRRQFRPDLGAKLQLRGLWDQDQQVSQGESGQVYVVKDVYTLSNTTTNKTATGSFQTIKSLGAIAGANVEYKGRYILDGTFRYDGSSLFGAGNRWAPFGRISAVWRVAEEPWYKLPHVTDFRLRASRGTAGNTPSFSAQYETYACSVSGCSLGQAGNKNLKPETTTETELGADFTLFDRVGFEVTNANSSTKDQILNPNTASSLGFANQWQNAGSLANHTWEVAMNLPLINKKDMQWSLRATYDRTRTNITDLSVPPYYVSAGNSLQGALSFFYMTASRVIQDGVPMNRFGNIWGRMFYKGCGSMPASVQPSCGDGKDYQVNDQGFVVWAGAGNSWKDGITKNLWQTKLSAANSPWNYPLQFGHVIVDRPLRGEKNEGVGNMHIVGHTLPDFRTSWSSNFTYKRLTLYALVDATIGFQIDNQGMGWGLFDMNSAVFDAANKSVQLAKPVGYTWRAGGAEGVGSGGLYDQLGPNNYNVQSGSYAKVREMNAAYHFGSVGGVGDWTVSVVGRNLFTFTNYPGIDPETGATGGQAGSGLISQIDAFGFPTLRTFSFAVTTRF